MNIILVANESAGLQAVTKILQSTHNLAAVLTEPESAIGSRLSTIAKQAGCETLPSVTVTDPNFAQWVSDKGIDILINVHSLHLICPEVIQSLRRGAFNLHPGRLPQYAGLNAPSWAIYNQEKYHAVTIHEITPKLDAGDILYEAEFPLTKNDTGLSVSLACTRYGIVLLEQFLKDLDDQSQFQHRRVQNPTQRRIYRKSDIPNKGKISWSSTAQEIDAFVRASFYAPFNSPWGTPYTSIRNDTLSVLKMEIVTDRSDRTPGTIGTIENGNIRVAAADQWITLTSWLLNGKPTSPDSFLHNGDRFT